VPQRRIDEGHEQWRDGLHRDGARDYISRVYVTHQ
jgi:hypothetical protein